MVKKEGRLVYEEGLVWSRLRLERVKNGNVYVIVEKKGLKFKLFIRNEVIVLGGRGMNDVERYWGGVSGFVFVFLFMIECDLLIVN